MKAKKKRISIIDKHGNKVEHEIEEETKAESSFATAMKYSNVGFYLITPLLGGLALGIFLDSFFKTKPLCTIFFLLLGVVMTFYNLFKIVNDNRTSH